MAVIGTYNGVSIIELPSTPAPKQVQLEMNNLVAAPNNPFTGAPLQVLAWPGGDYWTAQIALPKLRRGTEVATWAAFLAECRGRMNTFLLGDSSYKGVQGHPLGVPVVNGAHSPMATALNVKGFTASRYRHLLPGDYLQLGYRLHRVLNVVNSDSSGHANISIWPSLRDPLTDNQSINLNAPVGLFRMADNKQSVLVDETLMGAVSFNVVEAR